MVWDTSNRNGVRGPQLQTLDLSKFGREELILDCPSSSSSEQDANMTLRGLLSPIEEESGFVLDNAPLQVKVTIRFLDPAVRPSHYSRTYSSSAAFEPTGRICRGLLYRIEHCSGELITRIDPEALNTRLRRDPRFEINFQLRRDGFSGVWAERTFKSYQKRPVTSTLAKSILCSTHTIVCVFLRHHDRHFRCGDEPAHQDVHDKPSALKHSLAGAPGLSCVPRSRFIESTQAWEFVPGFTLELVLKSQNPSRRQALITRTIKVDSKQATPLNLGQGETLLWQAYRTLEDMLDSRRTAFEMEHADCDGLEGEGVLDCDCQHFDKDALNVELRILNNLGPYYEHLHRNMQSRLQLFRHACGNDCDEFMRSVHDSFDQLRDKADAKLGALNDFDLRVTELIGHGWRIKDPARFILDSKTRHTRQTIEALLDRIRTGVGDVLRGHDVAVHMVAHKQGHLVLDKALMSRNHQPSPGPFAPKTPEDEQALFVAHLKARIQADMDLVCKDTCNLDSVSDEPSSPKHSARSRPCTPRSTVSGGLLSPRLHSPVQVNHTTSYTPPGSPGHCPRPPMPPFVPPRSSSMRVFPLVPAKYREREEHLRISTSSVLAPAAEVFKHSEADYDDSSSSRSTCSSMPALTESESATPEQSLLITPCRARHSSPKSDSHGQFFNDFGFGEPSSPLVLATPDLSETTYQAASLAGAQGPTLPKMPMTSTRPDFDLKKDNLPTSVSDEALGSTETSSGTDSDSVRDQSCSREVDNASELHSVTEATSHGETSSGLGIVNPPDLAGHELNGLEYGSSQAAQRHSQYEGWLLHCVEYVPSNTVHSRIISTVTGCESSDTLRMQCPVLDDVLVEPELPAPQTSVDPDSIEEKHLLRQGCQRAVAPVTVRQEETGHSEAPHITEVGTDTTQMRVLSGVGSEELCSSRAVGDLAVCEPQRMTPYSEREHGISQYPEGTGIPDGERKNLGFGSTHQAVSEALPDLSCSERQQFRPDKSNPTTPSAVVNGSSTAISDLNGPVQATDIASLPNHFAVPTPTAQSPDVLVGPTLAERTPTQSEFRFASHPSTHGFSQPVTHAKPSTGPDGLESGFLLPSLPVFASLDSTANQSRASFQSSSSEWEDCVSEARQSSDSVDTIQQAPSLSDHDPGAAERPESPKRLGTPTAGILGFHESRWADFGIRGALTGSHTFDRPSTAPLHGAERTHGDKGERIGDSAGEDGEDGEDGEETPRPRPTTPHNRKSLHLLYHKKSISSIIFPGTHHVHQLHQQGKTARTLGRKGSKELTRARDKSKVKPKAKESGKPGSLDVSKEQNAEEAGRFPRAMMLITGLAIASSVVNRSSA
ncbi:hypothetical protein DHEL01_v207937 [Diaporthe helianthi]|uniref:Pt repeat family protein n=1 Tax=Diaporthe helianthi TaxID=158607 RepID=A0A2P5HTS8_DIAHE|nr:hypothetical protein DHEL01_v207937 [Diaporthe helianthi]